jgi:hypothetical protein
MTNAHGDELPDQLDRKLWQQMEALFAPDPDLRDQALDDLSRSGIFKHTALGFYLLASRISDPDLEVRFHVVQELGRLLDPGSGEQGADTQVLIHVQDYFSRMETGQLVDLLETADRYLSAEDAVTHILRLCSFAGGGLSAIINDRKQPLPIRRQAIYFSGQGGFLETESTIRHLLERLERGGSRKRPSSLDHAREEEMLYNFAVSALERLGRRRSVRRT